MEDDRWLAESDWLMPRGPLGESWPVVGPRKLGMWLTRGADGVYLLSPARSIEPGVPIGRLHGVLAAELFGRSVYDLQVGDPAAVWLIGGRAW